jgi:hypothetical protein
MTLHRNTRNPITRWTAIAAVAATVTVGIAAATGSGTAPVPPSAASAQSVEVTVWKSPTCGCCSKWVEHMAAAGFKVTARDTSDMQAVKRRLAVPDAMGSCHTAVVQGYVIEGHVPAADIQRLLREKPKVTGLAVPGMVTGSPGMEGGRSDPYEVVAFGDGKTSVFARH